MTTAVRPVASARGDVLVLAATIFTITLGSSVIAGAVTAIHVSTGISLSAIGATSALFGATYAVAGPTTAWFARRASPYRLMFVGALLFALAMLLLAVAGSVTTFAIARALQGVAAAFCVPQVTVATGALVSAADRPRTLARVFTGMVLSSLLGPPVGFLVAGTIGASWLFVLLALAGVVIAALHRGRGRGRTEPPAPTRPLSASAQVGIGFAVVLPTLAVALLESAGSSVLSTYLEPFLILAARPSAGVLTALLLCYGIGGIAGNWALGEVAERVGPARALVVMGALAAVSVAGIAVLRSIPMLALALLLWGFCSWAVNPALQSLILRHAGPALPLLVAVNSSLIYLGMAVGNGVGSIVVGRVGVGAAVPAWSAGILALCAVLACVVWASGERTARGATR